MACFDKKDGVRQSYWIPPEVVKLGLGRWYADLCVEVDDLEAIEQAKTIVDRAMPQKYTTKHGAHYYSFVNREFLLNRLLFFWKSNGAFPTFWLSANLPVRGSGHPRPQWLTVPTYEEAAAYFEDEKRKAKEAEGAALRVAHVPRRSYAFWQRWGKDAS